MLRHRLYRPLEPVSPDFDTNCLKCAQKGPYASMWNFLALANLLKVKVTKYIQQLMEVKHLQEPQPENKIAVCGFRKAHHNHHVD